jgi:hypothetical protein
MKWVVRTLLIASVAAGSAFAKTELDQLRDSAHDAGQRVGVLRARQSTLEKKLDELAPQIESLKKQKGLMASSELKAQLRRSQELSSQLTEVARSLVAAEAESERRNTQLLDALSAELQRLETAWDQSGSREQREHLAVQLRALRAEREKLRGSMPQRAVPSLRPSRISEEPEELLQQVDSLRDAEDKVKQQLSAVEARIGEVRGEQALDRRMREFINEQSLFDDQDRRFRLSPGGFETTPTSGQSAPGTPGGARGPESLPAPTTRSAEKPPEVQEGHPTVAKPSDTVESLQSERDRLRTLAQQLHEKALQLEQRARAKEQP